MSREYNKDAEFTKIGKCFLLWNTDLHKFYDQVRREYDEDLYLMYGHLDYLKKRLARIEKEIKSGDVIIYSFTAFSQDLVKEIETMIYSKEIEEKYEEVRPSSK